VTADHGTLTGYQNGCRCDECRSRKNSYMREYRKTHPPRSPLPADHPDFAYHGTLTGYTYGCRCGDCRKASTDYARAARQPGAPHRTPIPHGTDNGYRNYGCRCENCRIANTDYCRLMRENREGRNG
jgi:hypothetical protein